MWNAVATITVIIDIIPRSLLYKTVILIDLISKIFHVEYLILRGIWIKCWYSRPLSLVIFRFQFVEEEGRGGERSTLNMPLL